MDTYKLELVSLSVTELDFILTYLRDVNSQATGIVFKYEDYDLSVPEMKIFNEGILHDLVEL